MGRTREQAIAQSTPPPWATQIVARTLDDYRSDPVKIAWSRKNGDSSPLPPYPFHVYLIRGVTSLSANEELAYKLIYYLCIDQLADTCWHLEIFTTVHENVFECVDHYEQERAFRRSQSQAPYIPDKNCFLVVDFRKWIDEGLLYVQYTKENIHLPYNVKAERYKSRDHLSIRLRDEWSDKGRENIEEFLDKENVARGWQIDLNRYPESGPDQSVKRMILADEQAFPTSHQSAYEALNFDDISVHFNGAVAHQRQDLGGSRYTEIRYDASQAPRFVFCIFILGRGISIEDKLKVYMRLNTGLLSHISWALHLYSSVPMASAQSMFAHDMYHRNRPEYSTHIPSSYVGPPLQLFRYVYMCLDASKPQPDGPSFVLSNPDPNHARLPRPDGNPDDLDRVAFHQDKYAGEPDSLDLLIFDPGSWELASDMLHTYLAMCSQNQSIHRPPSPPIPRVNLRISANPEYSSSPELPSPIKLFITSHASGPITLNVKDTIFDITKWNSYLRITHAESYNEMPRALVRETPAHQWSLGERLLDYGFTKRVPDSGDDRPPHLVTLYPGVPLQLPAQRPLPTDFTAGVQPDENENDRRFLEDHEAEGKAHFNTAKTYPQSLYKRYDGNWEVGSKYTVELRDDTTIPRWTWGTAENLKGPYGLPALGIEVEEGGNRDFVLTN
ncbi:hypothetical protein E4T44_03280 [Aureobasidium sp. EXF-8845]|nr:hypothetical protein E4T44_03280 [Aureobasidium sp. EXF-8845]KAI4855300.1 hypothetical protein E4T45_03265 [Aureobasidium sp. EXF-8846]